ncbi:putative porin [Pontibacter burrus]|uniref:Putative porin n=1 Tax=Pontibacter burrus TaxID=2704466 RepID=A0A6B3LV40_9BACT|nr:putative porin [Pontibacter burrus]NEM98855.1 putative porin [Pontibacter burrus]
MIVTESFGQVRQRQPTRSGTRPGQERQQNNPQQRQQGQLPNATPQDSLRRGRPGAILDDTTQNLYGPKTTLQLFERDVLEGRYREQRVDTAIHNMHNQRYWFQDTAFYQHLGNVGTASQPLLFYMPTRIGVRLGKNAFDRYAYDPQKINYFDTRSPYSHLYYVQGQRGETIFEGIYARNITQNFNFGVAYQIISADKQIGSTDLYDDGLIDNQAIKVFSHYKSKNQKYELFANYTHLNHEQIESGGVRPDPDDTTDSLFRYENDLVFLNQASTQEMRHNYHLLHMFRLINDNLKIYHRMDWRSQRTNYQDDLIPFAGDSSLLFYPRTLYSNRFTDDETNFREFENEFGFTGRSSISYFKAYAKLRNSKLNYSAVKTVTMDSSAIGGLVTGVDAINQVLLGGEFQLNYQDKYLLYGEGEYQLTDNYRFLASARFKGLELSQTRLRQSPTLIQQRIISNHFNWDNDFDAIITTRSQAILRHQFGKRMHLRLMGAYTHIDRYVTYGFNAEPIQLNGNQQLLEAQLAQHLRFGGFHLENFLHYTNAEKAQYIRIPEWLVNSKLYFQGFLFKKALFSQIGLEMTLPSAYQPDAYMPVTQQFYLQNDLTTKNYPVFDVFLNADIKTVNVFLKMAHVNYGIWEPGYFETPGYPGLRRSFTFGLKWMFFD